MWICILIATLISSLYQGCSSEATTVKSLIKRLDGPMYSYFDDEVNSNWEIDWTVLEEVETTAGRLRSFSDAILKETDSDMRKVRSFTFVKQCDAFDIPFHFQDIDNNIEKIVRAQFKKGIFSVKNRLYDVLEALSYAYMFQEAFEIELHKAKKADSPDFETMDSRRQQIIRKISGMVCSMYPSRMLNPGDVVVEADCDGDGTDIPTGDVVFWKGQEDGREFAEAAMQTVLAIIGTFPGVGSIAGIMSPLLGLAMKGDDKNAEMIYKGFQKINDRIEQTAGIILSEIKLDTVRSIDKTAYTLMEYMREIYKQTDPEHKNRTIMDFIRQCEPDIPFKTILELHGQIKDVLNTQWENDSKHSKTKINRLKERLFKILNKLAFVYYFQHHLRVDFLTNVTIKERDDRINQLYAKLEEIERDTSRVLKELSQRNYWDGMKKSMDELMNRPAQNLSATSTLVAEYLRDIYTSDKFCVVTHLINEPSLLYQLSPFYWAHGSPAPAVKVHGFIKDDNEFQFQNKEYVIGIVRSKSAHETNTNEFYKKVYAMTDSCRDHSCKSAPKRKFAVILKQLTDQDRKADENNIVRCRINSALTFETPCEPWADGKMALTYRDETCKGIAFPT